jgi:hypothetical protein
MDCKLLYYDSEFILWNIDIHLISSIFIYWKISLLELVNRSQMDININYVIFEPGKNIHFSTYPPPTLIHLSHRFINALKLAS